MKSLLKKFNNSWFYSSPYPFFRIFQIFIKGDALVLLPFGIVMLGFFFFSIRLAIIILGIYLSVRYLGEMIYWLLHQFGEKTYRPYDFGLKELDNNAIYILYQLLAIINITIGMAIIIYAIFYMNLK